nr:putative GFA family protein [uncultured bacterium]
MAIDAGANIEISGGDSVSVFNSSDWAERAFCRQCGTHLYYRLKDDNGHHVLAGLFDKDQPLNFGQQIFIDEKPDWYSFAENTKNLTGAQVMAMFTGGD